MANGKLKLTIDENGVVINAHDDDETGGQLTEMVGSVVTTQVAVACVWKKINNHWV